MNTDPNFTTPEPKGVDLGDLKARADAADRLKRQAADSAAEQAALEHVAEWDKAMQRAFKGIVSRPQRHKLLTQASERTDA